MRKKCVLCCRVSEAFLYFFFFFHFKIPRGQANGVGGRRTCLRADTTDSSSTSKWRCRRRCSESTTRRLPECAPSGRGSKHGRLLLRGSPERRGTCRRRTECRGRSSRWRPKWRRRRLRSEGTSRRLPERAGSPPEASAAETAGERHGLASISKGTQRDATQPSCLCARENED